MPRWAALLAPVALAVACSTARPPRLGTQHSARVVESPASPARPERWWLTPTRPIDVGLTRIRAYATNGQLAVLGIDRGAVVFHDVPSQRLTLDEKSTAALSWRLVPEPFVGDWLLGQKDPSTLAVLNSATLRPLWELPLAAKHFPSGVARTGNTALVSSGSGYALPAERPLSHRDFVAVDAHSGRQLWRKEQPAPPDNVGDVLGIDGVFWVTTGTGDERSTELLDAQTGATISSRPGPVRRMLPSAHRVVLIISDWPTLLETRDARTGALIATQKHLGQFRDRALVHDGIVYILGQKLVAFEVETLKPLWATELERGPARAQSDLGTSFSAGDGAVVLCENDALRAFDQKTGAELWSYGLELTPCRSFALLPGPRLYLARSRSLDDDRGDDTLLEFGASSTPPEEATIRGRIPPYGDVPGAGAEVLVGNTRVVADAAGRFEARVATRGVVHVHAHLPLPGDEDNEKCDPGAQGHDDIVLNGDKTYVAEFELEQRCW